MSKPRIPLKAGRMYHVWTHANGDENLFRTDENYRYLLKKYAYHVLPVVETFAYCLMPNHLHLMIRVRKEKEVLEFIRERKQDPTLQGLETLGGFSKIISQQFSHLFNGYTQAYNKQYDRKGSLFTPNFERKHVDSNQYFTRLIAYIHNNPVHHDFVNEPGDWTYSSWHAYLLDKNTRVNKTEGLLWFGSRETFIEIHQQLKAEELIPVFEEY
jgi:REP element-mobilizing transposase RayT